MKLKYLSLFLLIIFTSACSLYHIESEELTSTYYPSKPSAHDVTYVENLDQPHETIGSVRVNSERRQRIHEVIEKMKREAAIIGADAITNLQSDATGQWQQLPAQEVVGNGYIRANFSATAVVYK